MGRVFNPVDGTLLCEVVESSDVEIESAIRLAFQAQKKWAEISLSERHTCLQNYQRLLEDHSEELKDLIYKERGISPQMIAKEEKEAKTGVKWALNLGHSLQENILKSPDGTVCYEQFFPRGVVGMVASHLFIWQTINWTIPALLLLGNSVVMGIYSGSALSGQMVRELWEEAGGDPDLIQLVFGESTALGLTLTDHPLVSSIVAVEKEQITKALQLKAAALQKPIVSVVLERPVILIDRDANLNGLTELLVDSLHEELGMVLLVVGKGDRFLPSFYEGLKQRVIKGHWGPFIDNHEKKMAQNKMVSLLKEEGGRIVMDGSTIWKREEDQSAFWGPVIIDRIGSESKFLTQESIGGVVLIHRLEKWEHGVRLAFNHLKTHALAIHLGRSSSMMRLLSEVRQYKHNITLNIAAIVPDLKGKLIVNGFFEKTTTRTLMHIPEDMALSPTAGQGVVSHLSRNRKSQISALL